MNGFSCRARLPLLFAAGFLLLVVVPCTTYYGLWFDEIFSVVMSRNVDSIVQMVRTQENNMLLHYLFLWLWQPFGDGSEVFLRASSVLLVLLSLWPLHAAARRLAGDTAANICCLFYASHFLVIQSAMACRGYSLALLVSALVFWRWAVAWQTARKRDWILAGAVAGIGVWAHYFSALVPPVLLFAMLWRDGLKQPWRQLAFAAVALVVTALPIVLTRPPDGTAQIGWTDVPTLRSVSGTLMMLAGMDGMHERWIFYALLAATFLALFRRRLSSSAMNGWRSVPAGIAAGLLLVVLAVLVESFIGHPLFVYRFFTPLVPLYSFAVAAGLVLLWPALRWLLLVATLVVSGYETWKPYVREPVPARYWWKPMVQELVTRLQPGDVILVYPSFLRLPVDYYLDILDPQNRLPRPSEYASGGYRQGGGVEPEPDWQRLQQFAGSEQRIWLVFDEKNIPAWSRLNRVHAPQIQTFLSQQRVPTYEKRYGTISVYRYDKFSAQ